ncbi:DNA-methyltransferase [Streptomyces koyangensis]
MSNDVATRSKTSKPEEDPWTADGILAPRSSGTRSDGVTWRLYEGDSRKVLQDLPSQSVDCVVTSPPYFWQRDYGVDGQFGKEPTIDGFVENLRETFDGLRNVLSKEGTAWLNLGDTYYSAKGRPHGHDAKHRKRRMDELRAVDGPGLGLPRKSMIGIPWRVALALQGDGWTLRSAIIWARETSIPEPTAHDRPHRKYEHLFLFTKGPKYFFNRDAMINEHGENEEDIWVIEPDRKSKSRGKHYAPYPRKLVERCVKAGCPEGGVTLDPFVGGGTTMSVSLQHGRSSVGIELNPDFCDLVAENMTMEDATLPMEE